MPLLTEPVRPRATPGSMFGHYIQRYREWQPFLLGWLDSRSRSQLSAESAS